MWVANHDERSVARIDLASGKVVADISVPSEPHRVAYGAGAVWVGNWHDDSVSRIDPATNRVVGSPIPIEDHHAGNLVVSPVVRNPARPAVRCPLGSHMRSDAIGFPSRSSRAAVPRARL